MSALFTKPQACESVVRNYFITIEKFKWHFESVSLKAAFLLICKITLALNNPELTALAERNLRAFQGLQPVEQKMTIEQQLALISATRAPKPEVKKKKKINNKKKKKESVETLPEPSPPASPKKSAPEPKSLSVKTTLPQQEEETSLSLSAYLARAKWLSGDRLKLHCPPVERIMDLFNPHACADNKYKFATFLMGGAIRDLLLQRTPKDWDINIFASIAEIREMLETHKTLLQIEAIRFVEKGYVHFVVTFTDTPNVMLDISSLDNTSEKSLHRVISDTQKSLNYDVNSLFYTRLNGCSYVRDPHQALAAIENLIINRIDCEQSDKRITTVMIRGALLLKKCPELKPSDTLLAWYAENKALLATTPAAKRTFVKLLYSDMACEALAAMHRFGFLEQLCPELTPVFEKPYYIEWIKAFIQEESAALKARAESTQEEFEKVHGEVLQRYLMKASTRVKLTEFTFKPQKNGPHSVLTFKPEEDAQIPVHVILPPTTNMRSSKNGDGN